MRAPIVAAWVALAAALAVLQPWGWPKHSAGFVLSAMVTGAIVGVLLIATVVAVEERSCR